MKWDVDGVQHSIPVAQSKFLASLPFITFFYLKIYTGIISVKLILIHLFIAIQSIPTEVIFD